MAVSIAVRKINLINGGEVTSLARERPISSKGARSIATAGAASRRVIISPIFPTHLGKNHMNPGVSLVCSTHHRTGHGGIAAFSSFHARALRAEVKLTHQYAPHAKVGSGITSSETSNNEVTTHSGMSAKNPGTSTSKPRTRCWNFLRSHLRSRRKRGGTSGSSGSMFAS